MNTSMAEHVTILGDGAMGTVCTLLLDQTDAAVSLWGAFEANVEALQQNRLNVRFLPNARIPLKVKLTADPATAFAGATLVVNTIPTQFMRSSWQKLAPHLPPGVPVVSCTKGVELDTLLRPSQVIASVLEEAGMPVPPLGVMSGPTIAAELAKYLPATAVAASTDAALAERTQRLFTTQWFRIYTSTDPVGIELAGAVKNVIAIAAGVIDGLGAGNNAKAALLARGLVEIKRLGAALGAEKGTFDGLAGLGDLVTTCISPEGRNRSVGEQIGKGKKLAEVLAGMQSVAEGVETCRAVHALAERHGVEMPIVGGVYRVLFEDKDVLEAISDLMTRELKAERVV